MKTHMSFTDKRFIGGCCAAVGAVVILGYSYNAHRVNVKLPHNAAASIAAPAAPSDSGTQTLGHTVRTIDPAEAYSSRHPALMALSVGDTADKVASRYGSPARQYVMNDAKDPITVYEYEGFNVGIGPDKLVRVVEMKSGEPDPGLGGLRLGQNAADAVKALGKPDISTDYILAYQTKNTTLKLDVDPKTKIIQSIKLFSRS